MSNRRTIATGLAGALLLGSGLVALVSDSVTGTGYATESPGVARRVDLQIAPASDFGIDATCGEFGDTATAAFSTGASLLTVPPDEGWEQPADGFVLAGEPICLRNDGRKTVFVTQAIENVISTDLGCQGEEDQFDSECSAGAAGELDAAGNLDVMITFRHGSYVVSVIGELGCLVEGGSCTRPNSLDGFSDYPLEPGEHFLVRVSARWMEDIEASQTDHLQFDMRFTGTDVEGLSTEEGL